MLKLEKIINKCENQKTIATHLVLAALKQTQANHDRLKEEHQALQHYSNKHKQIMHSEIKRLKETNRKLRENSKNKEKR